ncbi:glycogen synthase kinase 3 [Hesseltinella vesiculosa]|uniref:Glycogen synthase kinase 3 n=1 Tax=Hesseltinella vesiculosa TaxID=101127 RepID=A0A1X2GJW3_9FUNG|nr:glycogen synthase kinase 3 [Hesseltinella vesiculosa]
MALSSFSQLKLTSTLVGDGVDTRMVHVQAKNRADMDIDLRYTKQKSVGHGSFGVVYLAKMAGSNELIAIKKVHQDKRFKNRELQILRSLDHPNICQLKAYFYTQEDDSKFSKRSKKSKEYLNLIMDYMPETVYSLSRQFTRNKKRMPSLSIKLYIYQLFRALAFIHHQGVCHRDIKPQNLLVNPANGTLQLCDFGSAKVLVANEPNVAYICSRYYRAPELVFGATRYTTAIDMWSAACVMAEMYLGTPLFPGKTSLDQLVQIIKILGSPTPNDLLQMNPQASDRKKLPHVDTTPLEKVGWDGKKKKKSVAYWFLGS